MNRLTRRLGAGWGRPAIFRPKKPVVIARPQSFMNLSGGPVRRLMRYDPSSGRLVLVLMI